MLEFQALKRKGIDLFTAFTYHSVEYICYQAEGNQPLEKRGEKSINFPLYLQKNIINQASQMQRILF